MWDDMELSYAKEASVVGEEIRKHRRLKDSTFVIVNNSEKPRAISKEIMRGVEVPIASSAESVKNVSCLTHKTESV
jgi:hypothetical protein